MGWYRPPMQVFCVAYTNKKAFSPNGNHLKPNTNHPAPNSRPTASPNVSQWNRGYARVEFVKKN